MPSASITAVTGLKELDAVVAELIKATSTTTARGALRRGLVKAGEPTAERARELAPVRTGHLRDSITVSARVTNKILKGAYHAAKKAGLSDAEAVTATRDALRAAKGAGSSVTVFIGPGPIPQAHLVEFGTATAAPHPYLRPAWEQTKDQVLANITTFVGQELEKAALRASKRARRLAARAPQY